MVTVLLNWRRTRGQSTLSVLPGSVYRRQSPDSSELELRLRLSVEKTSLIVVGMRQIDISRRVLLQHYGTDCAVAAEECQKSARSLLSWRRSAS